MADEDAEADVVRTGFFDLYPELREMVYELAYGEKRTVKIITRPDLERQESRRKRTTGEQFVARAFPESFLSHIVVVRNKQFFEEAARVWVRTKHFDIMGIFYADLNEMTSSERYLLKSITSINCNDVSGLAGIRCLRRLTRLDVGLELESFESGLKSPWVDDYTDAELAATHYMDQLFLFQGIRYLNINWRSDDDESQKYGDTDRLNRFRRQVEALARDVVCQPRERDDANTVPQSFQEALDQDNNSTLFPRWTPRMSASEVPALRDREIPETESQLVRVCLSKPKAMIQWIKTAQASMTELEQIRSKPDD